MTWDQLIAAWVADFHAAPGIYFLGVLCLGFFVGTRFQSFIDRERLRTERQYEELKAEAQRLIAEIGRNGR